MNCASSRGSILLLFLVLFCAFEICVSQPEDKEEEQQATTKHRWCRPQTCYELLNVSSTAAKPEIRKAYHKKSLQYHPDKVPLDQRENSSKIFVEIANAWEILSNENIRQSYDEWLASGAKWDDMDRVVFYGEPRVLEANWITSLAITFVCTIPLLIPYCAVAKRGRKTRWSKFVSSVSLLKDQILPKKKIPETVKTVEPKPRPPREPKAPSVEPRTANIEAVSFIPTEDAVVTEVPKTEYRTGEWEIEEDRLLGLATIKFPGGTNQRWEKVSKFVGTRSPEQVVARVKELKAKPFSAATGAGGGREKASESPVGGAKKDESVKTETIVVPSKHVAKNADEISGARVGGETGERPWLKEEQRLLEVSLVNFPAADPQRWDKISAAVGTRTRKECVARYKELAAIIKAKKASLAPSAFQ